MGDYTFLQPAAGTGLTVRGKAANRGAERTDRDLPEGRAGPMSVPAAEEEEMNGSTPQRGAPWILAAAFVSLALVGCARVEEEAAKIGRAHV